MSLIRAARCRWPCWPRPGRAQGAPTPTKFTIRVENISKGEVPQALQRQDRAVRLGPGALDRAHRQRQSDLRRRPAGRRARAWSRWPRPGIPSPWRRRSAARAASSRSAPPPGRSARRVPARSCPARATSSRSTAAAGPDAVPGLDVRAVERPVLLQRPADRPVRRRGQAGEGRHDRPALAVGRGHRGERGARARARTRARGRRPWTPAPPRSWPIAHVRDRFTYPRTGDVLRLTITPAGDAMSSR